MKVGDFECFDDFCKHFEWVIKAQVTKWRNVSRNFDELMQAGREAAWRCWEHFQSHQDEPVEGYLTNSVKHAISDEFDRIGNAKNTFQRGLLGYQAYDESGKQRLAEFYDSMPGLCLRGEPCYELVFVEASGASLKKYYCFLTLLEREIFELYYTKGLSPWDISDELQMQVNGVSKALARGGERIRAGQIPYRY